MAFPEIRLGLPPPEKGATEYLPPDFNAMRKAIAEGARDSALIASCMRQAQHAGLSGEDTYVMLAFQALVRLEDYYQRALHLSRIRPLPPIIPIDGKLWP